MRFVFRSRGFCGNVFFLLRARNKIVRIFRFLLIFNYFPCHRGVINHRTEGAYCTIRVQHITRVRVLFANPVWIERGHECAHAGADGNQQSGCRCPVHRCPNRVCMRVCVSACESPDRYQ